MTPTTISDELAAGIARYTAYMNRLRGTEVTIVMPDGVARTGVISEAAASCQPRLITPDGRRYRIEPEVWHALTATLGDDCA